jgi:hypothetical protein
MTPHLLDLERCATSKGHVFLSGYTILYRNTGIMVYYTIYTGIFLENIPS